MVKHSRGKSTTPAKRIWRMSKNAPTGEWVDVKPASVVLRQSRDNSPEDSSGCWLTSSYELLSGTDVVEGPDTLPIELLDGLFVPGPDGLGRP